MKIVLTLSILLLIPVLLFTCGNRDSSIQEEPKTETPDALDDSKAGIDLKSSFRKGNGDLLEQIYEELADKTPGLAELEDNLTKYNDQQSNIQNLFVDYNYKSTNYYRSASNHITSINDSLLKSQMLRLIASSEIDYSHNSFEIKNLLKKIDQNDLKINDYHTVLKIVKTLPLIKDYQKDHLPKKKPIQDLIEIQKQLIHKEDSFIHTH